YLRLRPPPTPTLFPYTTLFRSINDDGSIYRVDNALDSWQIVPTPVLRAGDAMLIPDATQSALASVSPDPPSHAAIRAAGIRSLRSEEHTSELQSLRHLVCRLLL